jgi:hypothetical protein
MSREAVAVALWRTRLAWTRTRCLHVAESSLAAAERLGNVRQPGQQGDARIFCQRAQDALLAVAAIDQMTEASPRRAVRAAMPRHAGAEWEPVARAVSAHKAAWAATRSGQWRRRTRLLR